MQEWMLAMLVISITLIIRDMAKTILAGNVPDTQEMIALCDSHPQKERVGSMQPLFGDWQTLFMVCHIQGIT